MSQSARLSARQDGAKPIRPLIKRPDQHTRNIRPSQAKQQGEGGKQAVVCKGWLMPSFLARPSVCSMATRWSGGEAGHALTNDLTKAPAQLVAPPQPSSSTHKTDRHTTALRETERESENTAAEVEK
mmetsp:Transcript_52683/g.132420  ORF Transcript_52683/g.132420 Transcript_52683/m.132420 type:complete len:127 (-) Transcript_52683:1514-1894(-)